MISHGAGKTSQKEPGSSSLGISQRWGGGAGGGYREEAEIQFQGPGAGRRFGKRSQWRKSTPFPSLPAAPTSGLHLSSFTPLSKAARKEDGFSPLILKW